MFGEVHGNVSVVSLNKVLLMLDGLFNDGSILLEKALKCAWVLGDHDI